MGRRKKQQARPRKASWLTRKTPERAAPAVQLVPSGDGWALLADGRPRPTEATRVRNSDVVSQLTGRAGRAGWRYRWQLAPLVAAAVIVAAAAAGAGTAAAVLGMVAVAAHVAATRLGERVRGRVWLSVRERSTVALYAAAGAGWCGAVAAGWWPAASRPGLASLVVLTAVPAYSWCRSRRIRPAQRLSARARQLLEDWPAKVTTSNGPAPLRGSAIVPGSVVEPAGQSIAFSVRLLRVHAEDADTIEVRRHLEVALGLGVGTAQLEPDRDNAAQLRITLTPDRHLEHVDAPWPGPTLHPNGDIDFAVTPAGDDVRVGLHNDAGVEHAAIVGAPGTGKSNSLAPMVLPGVLDHREVVWYADGGLGTSAAHLAGACDWWAVEGGEEWTQMIFAAASVCQARRVRRAERGLSAWRGSAEDDPILTLVFDEASLVLIQLNAKTAGLVLELLRIGRKLGVRIVQLTQDPMGEDWIGGRKARGLMAGAGTLVGHRPGDGTAAMLSAGSTASGIDLRALPPGPGWVGVIRKGQVLAPRAKVRYARPDLVLDQLDGFTPRELTGQDLIAAGGSYRDRVRGMHAAAQMRGEPVNQPAPVDQADDFAEDGSHTTIPASELPPAPLSADQVAREQLDRTLSGAQRAAAAMAEATRRQIVETVARFAEGLTTAQLVQETGIARTTVKRALSWLETDGQVRRDADQSWHATSATVAA